MRVLEGKLTHCCPLAIYILAMLSKFGSKKEEIMEKNSYEHHIYESVDDKSLSSAISRFCRKNVSASNGSSNNVY